VSLGVIALLLGIMPSSEKKTRMKRRTGKDAGDVLVKRMTLPVAEVKTTAGSIIALDASTTAASVQSAPASEFASFAARYQQFRVRSVELIMEPAFPANSIPDNGTGHGTVYVSDYIGSAAPGTSAQVLSDEGALITNTSKRLRFKADWSRNPNAKLWNPTSAALPVANSFGISFASQTAALAPDALAASTIYYTRTHVWVVEFRGAQ